MKPIEEEKRLLVRIREAADHYESIRRRLVWEVHRFADKKNKFYLSPVGFGAPPLYFSEYPTEDAARQAADDYNQRAEHYLVVEREHLAQMLEAAAAELREVPAGGETKE